MRGSRARLFVAASLAVVGGGCSSATPSGSTGSTSNGLITQTGRAIAYAPCVAGVQPVPGATVTVGTHTATTAADGTYSIQVPTGTTFSMVVTSSTCVTLTEAENSVTESYDRGDTRLIPTDTASFLTAELPNYSATGGLLTIELVKTGSCTDVTGTTVAISPASPNAVTQYPYQCSSPLSPAGTDPSATDGVFPIASEAVIYNLTPGSAIVTATSPKCKQAPYPYTDPTTGLTYDGTVTTAAGTGISFTRVFLE